MSETVTRHKHGRCRSARYMLRKGTDRYYWRHCGKCLGCRMERHEQLVGGCLAEAEMAACTVAVTLTYADIERNGQMVAPDGAVRLDYEHIANLKTVLQRDYPVRVVCKGEYGEEDGRAHWHLLLFFQWKPDELERLKNDLLHGSLVMRQEARQYPFEVGFAERTVNWRKRAPKLVYGWLQKDKFQKVVLDPETLYCAVPVYKKLHEPVRQNWKYWRHGKVQAEIVSAPDPSIAGDDKNAVNRAVRYVVKYLSKDAWKDSRKWRHVDFADLPEHVKQATKFGSREKSKTGGWSYNLGNPYLEGLKQALLDEFPSDDAVPLERRLMLPKINYRMRGGLGADYFRFWGRHAARHGESGISRHYRIAGCYKKSSEGEARRKIASGDRQALSSDRLFVFYMKETAFKQFARAFNAERLVMDQEEVTGPRHVFDDMETREIAAKDASSGAFGYHLWKKSNQSQRTELEARWSYLGPDKLKGLVPRRMVDWFIEHSKLGEWPEWRKERNRLRREGEILDVVRLSETDKVIRTSLGKFVFERSLDAEKSWWRRELVTVENLLHAVDGSLLPENAKVMRIEREGQGDQTPLAKWRPDKIRNRLEKLVREKRR